MIRLVLLTGLGSLLFGLPIGLIMDKYNPVKSLANLSIMFLTWAGYLAWMAIWMVFVVLETEMVWK